MQVERVEVIAAPIFPNGVSEQRFLVASPVFASRSIPNLDKKSGYEKKHYLFSDPESDALLTETLQHKLTVAGLPAAGATVRFDRTSRQAKSQKVTYRDIENMCSYCPVFIKGTPEQLSFAWTVGVGNSTGIGLGSLYLPDPTTPTLASQKNNSLHPNHSHQ
jgi:CRISPR-associated endoribonuclease Cas6